MLNSFARRIAVAAALVVAPLAAIAQNIAHEKYQLENGMTVILHQDKTLPIAVVNLWYRVGAREEPAGRSGFAHLFEHLMFMGTQRVPGNEFDILMETSGGANNASTELDRTNYFSWGPSSLLPTLLWLDADRLEDLGRTMDKAKLDRQRDIVRNELRQTIENTPYGKAEDYITRYLYPIGHPYHFNVAGTHEDLESATVGNVKDFFGKFYVPNNCSLVVAGDFDPAAIKPLIQNLFGTLPRGADVQRRMEPPAKLDGVVRTTMLDKVQLPMILMGWHSPAVYADGDAEMTLAAGVLANGKNSRLYKRLVIDEKLATDVSASQSGAGLGSIFEVSAIAAPSADLNRVEKIIDEELARFLKDGPTAAELEERQTSLERGKLSQLQSLLSIADKLNEYEYYFGEPNSFARDLDRYRKATPEGVRTWAGRVIALDKRAIIRTLPEEPERAPSARDKRPDPAPQSEFTPTAPKTLKTAGGIPIQVWTKPELPLVAIEVQFNPGRPIVDIEKVGVAELMSSMLDEGAGDRDTLAFSSALQSLGATLGAGAGAETLNVTMQTLKRNLDKSAALLGDAIRKPRFSPEDFERVKQQTLDNLRQADEEPGTVAARVGQRALFGAQNPYGWPTSGTLATVEPLTLADIKAAYASLIRPETATILVAGDITPEEAKSALDKVLGDWTAGPSAHSMMKMDYGALKPEKPGMRLLLVNRPDAVQTTIRFMAPAPSARDDGRAMYRVLNTALGGSFTSRLNYNLREQHGYTYGAGSRFNQGPNNGYFMASAAVKADVTGASLKEFMKEFARLRDGKGGDLTDEEITKARETISTETVQVFEGLGQIIGVAADLNRCGLPFSTISGDLAAMKSLDASKVNASAKDALQLDHGVLVLVGDKTLILSQIKDLGLPTPVEVDAQGEPVKPTARKDTGE
jgi:predicted Zn-dependent peptidase